MKTKLIIQSVSELMLMMVLYAVLDNVSGIIKYIVTLSISCLYLFLGRKNKWSIEVLLCVALPAVVYVVLGSMSALLSVGTQTSTVKVILFWIVPLLFGFSLYSCYGENMGRITDVQFLGSCLAYKLFDAPIAFGIYTWESVYSFTFGIFCIYYLYKKRWGMLAVALFFVWLAEKRIGILAVSLIMMLFLLLWLFRENKKLVISLWAMCTGVIFAYIYMIYSGIMEAVCWGANINTNGRVEMYTRMAHEFQFSPLFVGNGLGIVEKLLEYWKIEVFQNLHNDLLKFYIELGFVGLLLFLISYGVVFFVVEKKFGKTAMCFAFSVAIFSMLLFSTDNVSIYMIYTIPLYSTFFAILSSVKREEKTEEF